jgi:hypothetical protein
MCRPLQCHERIGRHLTARWWVGDPKVEGVLLPTYLGPYVSLPPCALPEDWAGYHSRMDGPVQASQSATYVRYAGRHHSGSKARHCGRRYQGRAELYWPYVAVLVFSTDYTRSGVARHTPRDLLSRSVCACARHVPDHALGNTWRRGSVEDVHFPVENGLVGMKVC